MTTTRYSAEELIGHLQTLPRRAQLRYALDILSEADEHTEQLAHITSIVWTYLVQEELWEADSMTLEEIKASINWSEVCKRISAYRETQKRRDRDSKGINTYWGGSYKDLLPQEMLPPYVSANLL